VPSTLIMGNIIATSLLPSKEVHGDSAGCCCWPWRRQQY
jgi:hypothetical protein